MRLASGSHVACAAAFRSASCEMSTSGHKPSGQDSTEPPPDPTEPALATGTLFSGISQYGRPQGRQMSSAVVSTSRATAFLGFGDNLELEKWRLGTRDFRVVGWEGSPGGRSWLNWPQRRCPSRVLGASCKGQRKSCCLEQGGGRRMGTQLRPLWVWSWSHAAPCPAVWSLPHQHG